MTNSGGKQLSGPTAPTYRFMGVALCLLFAGAVGAMVYGAWRQGIWLDEIWSLWFTEAGIPAHRLFHERWMMDTNPPLFYSTTWLFSPAAGETIFGRRLLNFIPVLYALGIALYTSKTNPVYRPFALLFSVLTLTSRVTILYFAEYRSYFWAIALTFSLLCLLRIVLDDDFQKSKSSLVTSILFFVTTVLALNVHYIATFVDGTILGTSIIALLIRQQWRAAALVILSILASCVPIFYFLRLELYFITRVGHGFWIHTKPVEGLRIVAGAARQAATDNIVAAVAVVAVVIGLFRKGRDKLPATERQALSTGPTPSEWRYAAALAAALAIVIAVLAAANWVRPLIVPRYLVSLTPVAVAIVSVLAYRVVFSRRIYAVLVYANAAVLVWLFSATPIGNLRWDATVNYVTNRLAQCPKTLVYALDPTYLPYPNQRLFDEPAVQDWGYQYLARLHGFKAQVVYPETAAPAVLSTGCPTLFWSEHVDGDKSLAYLRQTAFARSPQMQQALSKAKVFKDEDGMVIEAPPSAGTN